MNLVKIKAFLNRYAVLASVVYLALLGVFDVLRVNGVEWAGWALTALGTLGGVFAINPDPAVVSVVPLAVTSAAALYGAVVKIVKIVRAVPKG